MQCLDRPPSVVPPADIEGPMTGVIPSSPLDTRSMTTFDALAPAAPTATRRAGPLGVIRSSCDDIASALMVLGATAWNLVMLFPDIRNVGYPNDSAMHEQMVRFASTWITQLRFPATQWYPYLNLGSPHFLHYQELGALIFGSIGTLFDPDVVFHWSAYLLESLWPVAIYLSARVFRLPRLACGLAAAVSPFLSSVPGVGYEQKAYVWAGYGVWAQLCASWCLPFSWAATWRALEDRRWIPYAALAVAATIAFHFETGYLAVTAIFVLPFVIRDGLLRRCWRGAVLLGVSLVGAAWVLVPLVTNAAWAARNTYLAPTGLVRGYGARQDLHWLFTGATFDDGRWPVISLAVLIGFVCGCTISRRLNGVRPIVVLFICSLILSFGPTTWGVVVDVVPGHADIFFRRFLMGVHLSGIYLAGIGLYLVATAAGTLMVRLRHSAFRAPDVAIVRPAIRRSVAACVLVVVVLIPALVAFDEYDRHNSFLIDQQAAVEARYDPDLLPIVQYVDRRHDGRVFAGSPTTPEGQLRIGYIPMYVYLANFDVDTVGFTMRTASLMSQPENNFDPRNLSDDEMFGVRYFLLATGNEPPVPSQRVMTRGPFTLWRIPIVSLVSLVERAGALAEDRSTVGRYSVPLMRSDLWTRHLDDTVIWGGHPEGYRTAGPVSGAKLTSATVDIERADLSEGRVSAVVQSPRPAVVVLASSYDPGWQVVVNGRREATLPMAPALVGAAVGRGTSTITFVYRGFSWYPPLIFMSVGGLLTAALIERRMRRQRVMTVQPDHRRSAQE